MTSNRIWGVLTLGLLLTVFGICQLPTLLTFKSSLIPITGTLSSVKNYTTRVSSNSRYGHEAKSTKTELIFYLNEHSHRFRLMENIGDNYVNEEYLRIASGLRTADTVTVWIKKSELDYEEPTIFQIDKDGNRTLVSFDSVRMDKIPLTIFLLTMGIGMIGFFLWKVFPDKLNAWFH